MIQAHRGERGLCEGLPLCCFSIHVFRSRYRSHSLREAVCPKTHKLKSLWLDARLFFFLLVEECDGAEVVFLRLKARIGNEEEIRDILPDSLHLLFVIEFGHDWQGASLG